MRRSATIDATAILGGLSGGEHGSEDGVTSAVLDAAGALLSRHGLGRWSMDDVATVAGVGRATVYRRFASREELVNATLARDLQRFFATVADAVAGIPDLTGKVVEGILVGVRVARTTLLPELLRTDAGLATSLLNSGPVLEAGRAALVRQYETMTGANVARSQRADVELVAEALIRLGLSFLLVPGSSVDFDDDASARKALRRLVGPMLENRRDGVPPS